MPAVVRVRIVKRAAPRLTFRDSRIAAVLQTGLLRVIRSVLRYVRIRKVSLSIPFDFKSVQYIAFDRSGSEIGEM